MLSAFDRIETALKIEIKQISEAKFLTAKYYNYQHCVHVVLLASGRVYVVDPTGIQFGPEWPLVCDLYEYGAILPSLVPAVEGHPLGTNAARAGDIRRIED
jgi:hypothetical protein